MKEGVRMEIQGWPPEPLPRKRRKNKGEDEEPDVSELLDWIQKIVDNWEHYRVRFSQGTYRMGGGG